MVTPILRLRQMDCCAFQKILALGASPDAWVIDPSMPFDNGVTEFTCL